jgi:hypothetical protein
MALKASKNSGKSQFVEQANIAPGNYPARVVQIIDFGLQPQRPYKGKDKEPVNEIGFTYELVDEFMKDENGEDIKDKPRWISETLPFYGLYADKAKSTQRYNVFDPTGEWEGDFARAITQPVMVNIINNPGNNGKVYDNVASIAAMRPRDAANCPELVNPPRVFDLDNPDVDVFKSFPKCIHDKIKINLNYNGSKLQKLVGEAPAKDASPKEEEAPWEEGKDDNAPY